MEEYIINDVELEASFMNVVASIQKISNYSRIKCIFMFPICLLESKGVEALGDWRVKSMPCLSVRHLL